MVGEQAGGSEARPGEAQASQMDLDSAPCSCLARGQGEALAPNACLNLWAREAGHPELLIQLARSPRRPGPAHHPTLSQVLDFSTFNLCNSTCVPYPDARLYPAVPSLGGIPDCDSSRHLVQLTRQVGN